MAMKKKYEIEEEISRLEKAFKESSEFISKGILEGRTDLQVNIDNRSKINARLMTLRWVLNKRK